MDGRLLKRGTCMRCAPQAYIKSRGSFFAWMFFVLGVANLLASLMQLVRARAGRGQLHGCVPSAASSYAAGATTSACVLLA